jgi:hypothetical protein
MPLALSRTGVVFKKCDMAGHKPDSNKALAPVSGSRGWRVSSRRRPAEPTRDPELAKDKPIEASLFARGGQPAPSSPTAAICDAIESVLAAPGRPARSRDEISQLARVKEQD